MLRNCYRKQQKFSYRNETAGTINEKSVPVFAITKHSDAEKEMANRELNYVIEKALVKVPVDYRMVFSLREINGLSVAETAETLDITETNVKARLSRAKVMLRKELEKTYTAEDIFEFNLVYCDAIVSRVMNEINRLK
jgi:RNA polymerase sigma factor (sigma-70 family)